jgi:YbbR domain-containing protein
MELKNGFSYLFKKSSRAFVFSLFVSFFIWILINLSKTYEKTISVKLKYENKSKSNFIKFSDSILKVAVQGSGFSLLSNKLDNLVFSIDTQKNSEKWIWNSSDYKLKSLFSKKLKVLTVTPNEVNYSIKLLENKKVPIKSLITIKTKNGYGIVNTIFSKDSLLIFGPSYLLNDISLIKTDSLFFKDVFEGVLGEINLVNPNKELLLEQQSIAYNFEVERYTQGTFELELAIKNLPKNKKINIFPRQVKVQFQAPLSLFSNVSKEGFSVYVDYNDLNDSKLLPVYIDSFPSEVKNVKVLKKSVTYLLIEL